MPWTTTCCPSSRTPCSPDAHRCVGPSRLSSPLVADHRLQRELSAVRWVPVFITIYKKGNFPCWLLPFPCRYCGGTLVKEEPHGATSPSCQQRASTSVWLLWTASCTCLVERTRTMPETRPSMPSAPSAGRRRTHQSKEPPRTFAFALANISLVFVGL